MIEKFSDYNGGFIDHAGEFVFVIDDAEVMDSKKGDPMVKLTLKSEEGSTTVYHSLSPKARWSYNNLIACALKLTPEQKKTFELDYFTIHNDLLGKSVIGVVEEQSYTKEIKVPDDYGTFTTSEEIKTSYKVTSYKPVE